MRDNCGFRNKHNISHDNIVEFFAFRDHLPESAFMYQLLGLNLLFLLSQNRVAEFHTELERLPVDAIRADPYVKHPLALEQYLMEGSYNKIFLAKVTN